MYVDAGRMLAAQQIGLNRCHILKNPSGFFLYCDMSCQRKETWFVRFHEEFGEAKGTRLPEASAASPGENLQRRCSAVSVQYCSQNSDGLLQY